MLRKSPPKHRHDGTSPLPLGMDWSPPPKKWAGRDTVWLHDHRTGWSYCVTIPSWMASPDSKAFDGNLVNPIVFYRVQIGIQSPDGVTSVRTILRRFSDFLKLFTTLKRVFPKKNLPSPPPKHAFLRVNSSRVQLEERRSALEEWMAKLLSDIDLSRSVPVASFLDLEAAARSFFAGSSLFSPPTSSVTPDYGSDNTYEASDLGTPSQIAHNDSEAGAEDPLSDQDLTVTAGALANFGISNHENGILLGDSAADQQGEKQNQLAKKLNVTNRNSTYIEYQNNVPYLGDRMELLLEKEECTGHTRKLSSESITSDMSSVRGSEISNIGASYVVGDGALDLGGGSGGPSSSGYFGSNEFQLLGDAQIVLPLDQRQKLNRVLITLQRRLTSARTDMEDMIARLNQEAAVKEYLTTKVKDLNVELDSTRQKSKENLQQAILIERERITQLQWDMEELRRQSLEMEAKFKSEQDEKNRAEATKKAATAEKELLQHELDSTKEQLENLQKNHEEQEAKMKADVKVLVKEVKSLRKSQTELRQELQQSLKAKSELEKILHRERQRREHASTSRVKLLHECEVLRNRLQECSVNFLAEEEDKFTVDSSSLSDALDLLATSDNRIGLLLAEAQLLAQEEDGSVGAANRSRVAEPQSNIQINCDDTASDEAALRKMLADILIDNARLRKLVNSVIRCALKTAPQSEEGDADEAPTRKTVLDKFLER